MERDGKELARGIERPNTMKFVGLVTDIIPPRQITTDKQRAHLIRMVIVTEEPRKGFTQGSVALQLPDCFYVSMIEPLRDYHVRTEFTFYCKAVRNGNSCFSVLNCIAIRPLNQTLYRKYNQVMPPRRKGQRKPLPPVVDQHGYKYPYNY